MRSMRRNGFRRAGVILASAVAGVFGCLAGAASAGADQVAPSLPAFVPHPSGWSPDFTVFPYNLWQNRVTPEQVVAQRDACQWFNAQYDTLRSQTYGFQYFLADQHDYWTATGVQAAADLVAANVDQSAAFLEPRARALFIVNYPDQSEYSPLYNGDSIHHLWYQLTQISDKIDRKVPSGQIHANIETMNVYGTVIHDSGVCEGA
jgi:hypothetical protein